MNMMFHFHKFVSGEHKFIKITLFNYLERVQTPPSMFVN